MLLVLTALVAVWVLAWGAYNVGRVSVIDHIVVQAAPNKFMLNHYGSCVMMVRPPAGTAIEACATLDDEKYTSCPPNYELWSGGRCIWIGEKAP